MTRETKIGLLVGLAFVLVVGILLSEHLTSATERPAAELAMAGRSVRAGVSAPGSGGGESLDATAPTQTVPMARDLTAANTTPAPMPTPVPQVTITTPAPVAQPTQTIIVQAPQPLPAPVQPPITVASNTPVVTQVPQPPAVDPFANDPVGRIAMQHGEPLVPVDSKSTDITPPTPVVPGSNTTVAATHSYKAQPGDTLAKIAARLPGGATKAGRDAVVALNPTLQKDPNKIIAGRSYLLPADVKTVATTPVTTPGAIVTVPQTKTAEKAATVANADPRTGRLSVQSTPDSPTAGRVYVVKAGDTLIKIALAELGSKAQVDQIKKLNEDALKGSDKIMVNMKLKLPEKA